MENKRIKEIVYLLKNWEDIENKPKDKLKWLTMNLKGILHREKTLCEIKEFMDEKIEQDEDCYLS